jgi:hypothetical protein
MRDQNPPRRLREIAAMFGVTHGVIARALAGQEPRDAAIRGLLGLPAMAPAPVCPVHGVVHVTRRCPVERARAKAKRRDWKRFGLFMSGLWITCGQKNANSAE